MNHKNTSHRECTRGTEYRCVTGCNAKDDSGTICGETFSLGILKLFHKLYADRLKKVSGNSEVVQETLQWWVQDLTEQNFLLVDTVEKLEQEIVSQFHSMASEVQREALRRNFSTQTEPLSCSQCATHTQTITDARTSSAQTESQNHSEARTQTQSSPIETPPWINHLKALNLSRPKCSAETQTQLFLPPVISHQSSAFRTVAPGLNSVLFRPVPSARSAITLSRSTQTNERVCSSMSRPTQTPPVYWVSRFSQTMESPLRVEKSVQALDFVSGRLGEKGPLLPMAMRHLGCRLRADANTQTTAAVRVNVQTETGPDPLRTQLAEAMKQVQGLHNMLRDSHKASHDTQEALTLEVAQKHDQILALKKEVQQLEERLLHADKQTHFKDDIIREMRKQLKMASSKVNSGSPEPTTMRAKGISFGRENDYPSPESSSGCGHTPSKNCNRADVVTSLQNELRSMEKELNQCRKAIVSGASLADLEEFRVRTVEAQAAVEDLRDELGELVSESRDYETQMEVVRVALENCSVALGCARSRLSNWRPPDKNNSSNDHDGLCLLVESAREALQQAANSADSFLRGRDTRQELRERRERRVDRLQEELDGAHDAMRDGVETLSKAVNAKSRQMADQAQDKNAEDVCDGLECVHLERLNKLQEEFNRQKPQVEDSTAHRTDSTESTEWLKTELNILTRNLQAKDKMLADKEEMVSLLQDSLDRAREEIRTLKEQPMKKELLMDLKEMHHQFQLCFTEAARQEQGLISLRSAVHELRERAERESRHAATAEQEADRLRSVALLQTARGSLLERRLQMVEERLAQLEVESCSCAGVALESNACWTALENIV